MTLVNIDLRNVAGETGRHDQVVFHAPVHREGSAGQTIQTAPVIVDLEGGIGSVDLDPGPVVVEIRARGWEDAAPKTVMVPEEGPITLTGLLLDAFEWAPVVVSEVRALAQRVETVANTFGSLEGVAVSVQAAEDAAASATSSATAAASSAASANDSQVSAASSATAAAQSAVNAADSEWVAGEHKGAAEAASAAAASSASDASASAGAAASSESAAATSAGQADASAGAASDAADRAENVVDTVQWQGDQLSVMGKVSPPLTGDDGETPHIGANGNWWVGDTDTGVRAQGEKGDPGDGSGDVLWSELNPVLDGKADVGHSHSAADVGASPVGHKHPSTDISDATATGRSVLTAASQAAARSAIGAGTSSLTLGTTASTAARGDHTHTPASLGAAPASHTHSQYAESSRVTALEGSQPIIVSSLPSSPLPGRIYLVTG